MDKKKKTWTEKFEHVDPLIQNPLVKKTLEVASQDEKLGELRLTEQLQKQTIKTLTIRVKRLEAELHLAKARILGLEADQLEKEHVQ